MFYSAPQASRATENTLAIAIDQVLQICQARIEYNTNVMRFIIDKTQTREKIIEFLALFLPPNLDRDEAEKPDNFTKMKNIFFDSARKDAGLYQKIIQELESLNSSEDPDLIDTIYLNVFSQYNLTKKNDKKLRKTKKYQDSEALDDATESLFLGEIVGILKPFISPDAQSFLEDVSLTIDQSPDKPSPCSWSPDGAFLKAIEQNRIKEMVVKIIKTYGMLLRLGSMDNTAFREQSSIVSNYLQTIYARTTGSEVKDILKWHRDLKDKINYLETKNRECDEIIQQISEHFENMVAKQETTFKHSESLAEVSAPKEPSAPLETLSSPVDSTIPVEAPLSPEEPPIVEACRTKINLYRAKVEQKRLEKTQALQGRYQIIKAQQEARKALKQRSLEEQKSASEAIAFERLFHVNQSNLGLLETIFQKPTPHTIPYTSIETLFGTYGGLAGSLSSSAGGSHRKIQLAALESTNNTMGFFDYKESPAGNVSGSTFQAHGKKEGAKMPAVAIFMIRSTLERAGITQENLELFIRTKQKAAEDSLIVNNHQELLAMTQDPVEPRDQAAPRIPERARPW